MKIQELKNQEVNIDDQFIIPTQKNLESCRKYKIPLIFRGSHAIFVKKMASTNRFNWTSSWRDDKSVIQSTCSDFSKFDFLVNFQYKKGTTFNANEMQYFERVQQIPELNNICMVEKNPNQTMEEFSNQLEGWISRNSGKRIIPVIDPSAVDLDKKILLIKNKDLNYCGVIFRGFKRPEDRKGLSKVLASLRSLKMFSFVFGISPSRFKNTGASMFYPAIHFKANCVSPWVAWSGREAPMTLLCSDWTFKKVEIADKGLADYGGKAREDFLAVKTSKYFNTALSQVDAINQGNELIGKLKPLIKIQFKNLFG